MKDHNRFLAREFSFESTGRAIPTSRGELEITLACDARNVSQRPSEASACARADVGVPRRRGHLSSSCGHENRVAVYVFASMADRSVS